MNIMELTVRRIFTALLTCACFLGAYKSANAQGGLPTVTIMHAGAGEFEDDLEAVMKLAGKKGEEQWPVIQAILPAFNQGIDKTRPIRVDVIFGKERDYRMSIPYTKQKDILDNVAGFIGAKPRRIGTGLYALRSPAFNGFLRDLSKQKYVVIAADRNNLPANFNPLPDIQPLINAGYDMAASVTNTADGMEDRKEAIDDLRQELLDALKKVDDETDAQFEIRRVGLIHQLKELERLFSDSESLVLGWTTDAEKKEGRLALELTALPNTPLANSISELGAKNSHFAGHGRSDNTMFFGHINHSLDAMRQQHISDMLGLLKNECLAGVDSSEDVKDENKDAAKDAIEQFYAMLGAGNKLGVIDGFVDISNSDDGRSIVGGIRATDGKAADKVLKALKDAGWEVELAAVEDEAAESEAESSEEVPEENAEDAAESADETEAEEAKEDAAADSKDESDAGDTGEADESTEEAEEPEVLAYHTVKVPVSADGDLAHLFGANSKVLIITTEDSIFYAAGANAEERVRNAASIASPEEPTGIFLETWTKVGPWIDYLKGRRERREEGQDLSKLSDEEKKEREERIQLRDMALEAFGGGQDTIHTIMRSDQKKVTGMTVFSEGILRFVGMVISDFAASKLN